MAGGDLIVSVLTIERQESGIKLENKKYFAVDIGGTAVKWAIVTDEYEILKKGEFPTTYEGPERLVESIASACEEQGEIFAGIGISAPGTFYDEPDGIVYGGGSLTFMDKVPLGKMLRERVGLPCFAENDGKSCALGEYSAGALKGCKVGIVMVLGTGIGGGIVIDGNIFKGAHSFAGEFSFICDDPEKGLQEWNEFGKSGGWKTGLQMLALKEKGIPMDADVDGRTIFEWINNGDESAIAALETYCKRLALKINNLQVVLDPEVVAIGGGISNQPVLLETLQKRLDQMYGDTPWKQIPVPKIVHCEHGSDANLLGAVYHCKSKM